MKNKHRLGLLMAGMVLLVSACAPQQLYSWNGYSSELLSYYKNPGEQEKFAGALLEDIEKAEEKGGVPPGIYAEYGYLMLELGNQETAVVYFQKERDMWPEAAFLMNGVISRLATKPSAETTELAE